MSLLKLFSGPSPERLEEKGDAHCAAGQWGRAKLAYESALDKRRKRSGPDVEAQHRLAGKIRAAADALAAEHRQAAHVLLEGGYEDDARSLLTLAAEVAADPQLKATLETELHALASPRNHPASLDPLDATVAPEDDDALTEETPPDDYFLALCGTLPQEVRKAYLTYGPDFKNGYIALNRGDFRTAVESLSRAREQNPRPDSYVPLELASALLNLDRPAEARELLETFLESHPQALPAYQLLCDIYWEAKDFDRADALLTSLPEELVQSVAAVLLKGETLFRAGRLSEARDFYRRFLEVFGWKDPVVRELAKVHEALEESAAARAVYQEIMARCRSCRDRVDPAVKHRYAELCFADGVHPAEILEIYLALAREIPENAALYFERVSRIYASQGNAAEAERFRSLARRAAAERE